MAAAEWTVEEVFTDDDLRDLTELLAVASGGVSKRVL